MISKWAQGWGLKLISLVLAMGLWYYAVGEENIEVVRKVPLQIQLKNDKLSILRASDSYVKVTLQAPRALLSDMTTEGIVATHVIGEDVKAAGEYSFQLNSGDIKLPAPQIQVVEIRPEAIQVTIDELIVQKVKIEPNFVGEPAVGYKVVPEEIQIDPNAILAEGPKGELEKTASLKTEEIDLVGRIRSFRRTVGLELPSNVKPLSETLVDIYVPIREESEERIFQNVPVKILKYPEAGGKVQLNPAAISFALKGSKRQLDKLTVENILAYLDVAQLRSGEYEMPVHIVVPEDVSLKDERPVLVQVKVKS
jgi:YbbR domain-containing protein